MAQAGRRDYSEHGYVKMTTFLRTMLLALLATSCGKEPREGAGSQPAAAPPPVNLAKVSESAPPPAPPSPSQAMPAQGPAAAPVPRMLARTGNATIEVRSLEAGVRAVRVLAERVGAFVESEQIQSGRRELRQASLVLKVPAARFDEAVQALPSVGDVESVQVAAEDVGDQYVDVTARLANSRKLEQRLLDLLATRTGRLEDVLAVERELARVREEIDRYTGRAQYLQTRVNVSTLTVNIHEPQPLGGGLPGRNPVLHAFGQAWSNFVDFVAALIASLGILVPLAALLLAAWWIYRRIARRRAPSTPENRNGPGPGPS